MKKIILIPLIFVAFAFAASDSILTQQRETLKELQKTDESSPGVLLTGDFNSAVRSSILDVDDNTNTDIEAFSQANIKIEARPTAETRATVKFRVHQDWQKSREEGISPFAFHWISYDGRAWKERINFNLGDMRAAYTPLTIYMPDLGLKNEPEIFAKRRQEAMEYSDLDDNNRRLLQGLNFSMNSGKFAFIDDLFLQGTGSRLRAQSKKNDQYAMDIDLTDRFLIAGRGGAEAFGISLAGGYVYTFSRLGTAKNFDLPGKSKVKGFDSSFMLEDNGVFTATLGVDIAKLAGMDGWQFKLGGEFARSYYKSAMFSQSGEMEKVPYADTTVIFVNGLPQYVANIIDSTRLNLDTYDVKDIQTLEDNAIHATIKLSPPKRIADMLVKARFIHNGKDFVSELAQSPQYLSSSILNSSAVNGIRGGTLENIYFATYNNNPLTQLSMFGEKNGSLPGKSNLYNNYKKAHYVRTGFTANSFTPSELMAMTVLDPAINLSLPFGYATPDRTGAVLDFEIALLDNKININANGGFIMQGEDLDSAKAPSFIDFGGGASVEIGRFVGLSKPLTLQAGFQGSMESDGYERSSQNITAGFRWGIWRGISLLGGFGMVNKDYGIALPASLKSTEMLVLAGPEVKLSEGAYFNAQGGILNTSLDADDTTTDLNRILITADVHIKF